MLSFKTFFFPRDPNTMKVLAAVADNKFLHMIASTAEFTDSDRPDFPSMKVLTKTIERLHRKGYLIGVDQRHESFSDSTVKVFILSEKGHRLLKEYGPKTSFNETEHQLNKVRN